MRRITTITAVAGKFGAGKPGFTDGDVIGGVAATDLNADWFDQVQEEISNVIELAGIALSGGTLTQLKQAIDAMIGAKAIGVGQTWQNLLGSRAINTTYTNTTGRPITVSATVTGTVASSTVFVSWTVAGVNSIAANGSITGATPGNTSLHATAVVPAGATYQLVVTQGSLSFWNELR
ncbi:hypothetical protein RD110_18550 [Rhodoferax koreense]|uniref:Uncharacterized protein n=1 Tax=Rhodoferax koreensis TaxID=1842727 RepID=A0A1P8JYX6_9BURK|nr:hypothetical protein [Rhodoferax koreense]APW38957.1 hypothetical protein RD110_18550 [Rhodoferax koreense]